MSHLPHAITGDRPTGPLHLGHYAGSLKNRVALQQTHDLTVLVADGQAMTDNAGSPEIIRQNISAVMLDYLAAGLDPSRVTFVLQSAVPALSELTVLFMNLVSLAHLERNPTVRHEMVQKGFGREVPIGFLCYPVSQAADILGLGSGVVPVGDDQLPMIEVTNLIADRVNRQAMTEVVPRCVPLFSHAGRLPSVDGKSKMSKSQGNSIGLSATRAELQAAIHQMYTDPNHLRVSDPGQVEGNVVFAYLDAFDNRVEEVAELKSDYRRGGLGDMMLKRRLLEVLDATLAPIRDARASLCPEFALDLLREGTRKANEAANERLGHIKPALGLFSL